MKALLIVTASMIAGVAHAEAPETTKDLQCMVAYSYHLGTTEDVAAKASLAVGLFYYQGRIEGREPGLDFPPAFKRELYGMSDEAIDAAMTRCVAAVQARSQQMQAIAKDVEADAARP
ncbi:hypothetical protein [Phenylobacterium sp.]|uniref:hypothetical protein n=1 Tax=Phenylobacterium sp. TaxID=1871053 RepID=UPI00271D4E6A|nr:hypothetical protein [Phenylobacterium sp.]MDO8378987.1 hypothetical protein [Phenylobacterium sp.]